MVLLRGEGELQAPKHTGMRPELYVPKPPVCAGSGLFNSLIVPSCKLQTSKISDYSLCVLMVWDERLLLHKKNKTGFQNDRQCSGKLLMAGASVLPEML